jgi:hypothetical protein
MLEVGDDHHVLGEPVGHRERLRERVQEEVSGFERRADDDVRVVELTRDQASVVPPVQEPLAAALDDPVQLGDQAAQIVEFQLVAPVNPYSLASAGLTSTNPPPMQRRSLSWPWRRSTGQ